MRLTDSLQYKSRLQRPFQPSKITLRDIHNAVPKHLLQPNSIRATLFVLRDIILVSFLYKSVSFLLHLTAYRSMCPSDYYFLRLVLKSSLWLGYWFLQSLVFAGIFCLGHDAGHGSLYKQKILNNIVGFALHSFLLIPYFSWRATHHAHHKATGSMERDENYVPYTRSSYRLPNKSNASTMDYKEIFEETPLMTLSRLLVQQLFGWWIYLTTNLMGGTSHPPGTNHFNPNATLFKARHRIYVLVSDFSLVIMLYAFYKIGWDDVWKYYLIPYFLLNHWIVMFTFLHHSDPTIPHYRKEAWTFLRGALATVDRPLLGWAGRFFFHNISHDHVAHHLFLSAPFFNGPRITEAIKPILGEDYNYDPTPSFYALWRSFTKCIFVEDEGTILFYKDRDGNAARQLASNSQVVQ